MKRLIPVLTVGWAVFFLLTFCGCDSGSGGGGDGGSCPKPTLDISLCDPATAVFSNPTTIDNGFFPLEIDMEMVLEGEEDGEPIRLEITVPGDTKEVAGINTLVMVEKEYEDGELVENSSNYMAQADDGTVCYFGEDVNIYEEGVVVSHEGAWLAGVNGAQPGIMMPSNPQVGQTFYQEYAEGVAQDMSSVVALAQAIDVTAGKFSDTVTMEDCNPLDDASKDEKVYVRDIGLAIDEAVELISY